MQESNSSRIFSPIPFLRIFISCFLMYGFISCTASQKSLFSKKTPHEQYADNIREAGLEKTELGNLWFTAAELGLKQPLSINLPYKEMGYFAAAKPGVTGYSFSVKRGEKISIKISISPQNAYLLFADLWEAAENNTVKFLAAADTSDYMLNYEVKNNSTYILRLQPELLSSGNYTLTITTGPSLAFPVPPKDKPRIGSFWADSRDNGARKHEGIDIFDKFHTPVVAAADGTISSVKENGLGGKVIFLRPYGKEYSLYYAHLDSQISRPGDEVKTGDTIGLMGNTGNAKYTPTHLHFGIYTNSGAVDPLPFVNRDTPKPAPIIVSPELAGKQIRTTRATALYSTPSSKAGKIRNLPADDIMLAEAATASWYKVRLPDNTAGFVSGNAVRKTGKILKNYTTRENTYLLEKPDSSAAHIASINAKEQVSILGSFEGFNYVKKDSIEGWIKN